MRWSAKPGRDPCLVDLAIHDSGDTIATYWYPAAKGTQLPVVRVDASGEARWLADDFDAWVASYLLDAKKRRADLVANVLEVLGLDSFFLREALVRERGNGDARECRHAAIIAYRPPRTQTAAAHPAPHGRYCRRCSTTV